MGGAVALTTGLPTQTAEDPESCTARGGPKPRAAQNELTNECRRETRQA